MSEPNAPNPRWLQFRMGVLTLAIIGLFGVVMNRMYGLQVEETDLGEMAERQVQGRVTLGAGGEQQLDGHRGYIFDRNGFELAISVEVPSIYAHPRQITDVVTTARELARILPQSEDQLTAKLTGKSTFVWLARKVTPAQGDRIRALKLPGIGLKRESKRFYPGQGLAGQIVGFAGVDNVGLAGVESAFDAQLRGGVIQLAGLRDARGQLLLTLETPRLNELEGASVVLSIDQHIQRITEAALERAAVEYRAKQATAIVMDPYNGEVLAMATWPRFNPNRSRDHRANDWRNRPVLDAYEPGSVFKTFVYAAAVEDGLVKPDTPIDSEKGRYRFSDAHEITDTHYVKDLTAEGVVVHSSNVGAYKLAKRLGRDRFYAWILDFGFGATTGIGVAGETPGIVWKPKRWAEVTFANIAFGQGLSVSPLQLAAAFSVLANGGNLVRPLLIKEVKDRSGNVVERWEPEVRRHVLSERAALQTRLALEKVVTEGTGMRAWVEGYRVGGKTGTAQKVDPRTKAYTSKWMANFVGMAPIDNPNIVVVVMVDEPVKNHFGGVVAAPVFAEIVSQVLPYRGVYPDAVYAGDAVRFPTIAEAADDDHTSELVASADGKLLVPDFQGMNLGQALAQARLASLVIAPSEAGFVVDQWPAAGAEVEPDSVVQLTLARHYRQSHLGFVR